VFLMRGPVIGDLMTSKTSEKKARHEAACKICSHPCRKQIEDQWCEWTSATALAEEYGVSLSSLARHMAAFKLRERRAANLRAALELIIEQGNEVKQRAILKRLKEWNLKHTPKTKKAVGLS